MASEYGFDFNPSICPRCGAGAHNQYRHDEDCVASLAPAFGIELLPWWIAGWDDKLRFVQSPQGKARHDATLEQARAYAMGARCASRAMKTLGESLAYL